MAKGLQDGYGVLGNHQRVRMGLTSAKQFRHTCVTEA